LLGCSTYKEIRKQRGKKGNIIATRLQGKLSRTTGGKTGSGEKIVVAIDITCNRTKL
jgi:hypothetical protein